MDIIKWGYIPFYVTPTAVRGIRDLNISVSNETEESEVDGEKFVKHKTATGYQITMKALLSVYLGDDVRAAAIILTECARTGQTGYFYCAGTKLFPSNFMMTNAAISNVQVAPNGTWTFCDVSMTFKQCSKYGGEITPQPTEPNYGGGTESAGVNSSGKASVRTSSTTTKTNTGNRTAVDNVLSVAQIIQNVSSKIASASTVIESAKKAETTVKTKPLATQTTTNNQLAKIANTAKTKYDNAVSKLTSVFKKK